MTKIEVKQLGNPGTETIECGETDMRSARAITRGIRNGLRSRGLGNALVSEPVRNRDDLVITVQCSRRDFDRIVERVRELAPNL